jgi:hypothetical protein
MTGYTSPPIRIVPWDRVVRRSECWRATCRADRPGYATVSYLASGRVAAFCHRGQYDDLGYRAAVWADARREAA